MLFLVGEAKAEGVAESIVPNSAKARFIESTPGVFAELLITEQSEQNAKVEGNSAIYYSLTITGVPS